MTINDREIIIVKYATDENWIKNIPNSNWLCILVDNDRQRRYLNEVISKIIDFNVCYVCTIGQSCEKINDLIDEEIVFREVDIDKLYLPNHDIITTWDNNFAEGIWFAIFVAHHEKVSIDKVVILDMTNGNEIDKINKLLTNFKMNG